MSHKHDSEFVKLFDTKENYKKNCCKIDLSFFLMFFKLGIKQLIENHPKLFGTKI